MTASTVQQKSAACLGGLKYRRTKPCVLYICIPRSGAGSMESGLNRFRSRVRYTNTPDWIHTLLTGLIVLVVHPAPPTRPTAGMGALCSSLRH